MIKVYDESERPPGEYPACYDCGLPYGSPDFGDVSLPHDVWEAISPSPHKGCGLLCPNCILRRLGEAGMGGVPAELFASTAAGAGADARPGIRRLELLLDADDHDAIQREIAHRQARSRAIDPKGPTLLPDGESNLAGAILAECVRDLEDYRAMFDADRRRRDE